MVFLINIVPFLIILSGLFVYLHVKGWKRKVGTVLVVIGLSVIYTFVQPSYMPKGTVKALPNAEFQVSDAPVVDLALKPKSSELYDAEREAAMERIDQSIKMQIEMNKQIKSEKE